MYILYILHKGYNSVRVMETLENIDQTKNQLDYQQEFIGSKVTSNKIVETETTDNNTVATEENITKIRTLDECLAIYKSQVKSFIYYYS